MKPVNDAIARDCATCPRHSRDARQAGDGIVQSIADRPSTSQPKPSDPLCLDVLQAVLDRGERTLNTNETRWLLDEAFRLLRIDRAFEARVAELESQLKAKDADYTGVCLEYADLADENSRLKQELEINRIVLDARGRTLLELQRRLDTAACEGK